MESKKQKVKKTLPQYYGGQAVMEGVMMRGTKGYVVSVRNAEQGIVTVKHPNAGKAARFPFLKWPVIRGVVSFLQSLVVGMKVISESAELAGLDDITEENPSKLDVWLEKKFGDKLVDYIMTASVVIALVLGVGLFMLLPAWLSGMIKPLLGGGHILLSILEGVMRIVIFLIYILLISRMKEIQRLFGYHGAEHKTLACYEAGEVLSPENAKKHSRLHKRCGTSFLLIVMVVSMVVFFFVKTETVWLRVISRVLLVPVIAGLSYELLRWAGRHDNTLVNIISAPGLMLQKMTTAEPDDGMLEVAIEALKGVLADETADAGSTEA